MPGQDARAKLFDRCKPSSPITSEFDLDSNEQYLPLGWLTHDYRSAQPPAFALPPNSPFRFQNAYAPERRVNVAAGAAVALCVEASHVRSLARTSPIDLQETVRLFRVEETVTAVVHVRLQLFRSSPPRPVIQSSWHDILALTGEIPADGYLQIGTIQLDLLESAAIEHRARADFVGRMELSTSAGDRLPFGVRRHCLDDDEKDRGWLTAGDEFAEPLELRAPEGRWRTNRFDIGVSYHHLRRLMRAAMPFASDRPLILRRAVQMFLRHQQDLLDLLGEASGEIELSGEFNDSIAFSGLCGMMPRRLTVTADTPQDLNFSFPSIRARLAPRKPPVAETVELFAEAPEQELEIELSVELLGGPQKLSHVFAPRTVGAERESFIIPATQLLEQARKAKFDMDGLTLRVTAAVRTSVELQPVKVSFEGGIVFESEPAKWLACIDFGTSSTALWIGTGTQAVGHPVGLGTWLSRIDRYHPESIVAGADDGAGEDAASRRAFLLPSHIGLSSDFNMRADFDPLSLGDLALAYPGPEAALRRLEALDRNYDISVPFPSTVQMADYIGTIITQPKRKMVLRAAHVAVEGGVVERGQPQPVQLVDLARVIQDYFHELGSYTAPNALSHDATLLGSAIIKDIERARLDPGVRFGVVVTHPCGIDEARRQIYRAAGQRFLQGFCGTTRARADDVILIPEALAAARYGIEEIFQEEPRGGQKARARETFVTLDIGAGTYDVTAIETDSPDANRWRVASHFGLTVGGADLDAALVKRIISVLQRARSSRAIAEAFDFRFDAARLEPRHRQWLDLEFQAAKARLTAQLLDAGASSYAWQDLKDGGPALDILVGRAGGGASPVSGDGVVVPRGAAETEKPIPGCDAKLVCTRIAGRLIVKLCLGPGVFAPGQADDLDVLMEVMGRELPSTAIKGASVHGKPIVVVTGRAALWPPLYQRIEQTVAEHGSSGARMSRRKPFKPDQMKHAVVLGAITLAREAPGRNLEAQVENPIALINFRIDLHTSGVSGAGRIARKVTLLLDDSHAAGKAADRSIVIDGPFVIARIMPGLEREEGQAQRLALFQQLHAITRVRPFVELTHELAHPLPGRRDGPVEWKVSSYRDVSGLRLTFDCGISPPIEFGPFGGGRMYVPD
ncbi:hypothetical protein [Bradyrhizobium aeschynomenes]|uniref:hypothetical protein n=1 Tax=Bradyrhizobium aeschynomenes TaxID=2734909 RepID=UPI001551D1EF|nr:hypothetical protein [Bradyrhizobium aeschynomenes]NPV19285.1 hypothetical protein [Bradyrhizobium aeschynomenes]